MCVPMAYNRPFQGPTGGASPSPTASVWVLCRGAPWGSRQDSDRCRWLGYPGAEVEPHQRQFLQPQGPVARREFRLPLKFCAPEIFCLTQGITPVMGSGESGPMGTKCPSAASPVAFCPIPRYSRQTSEAGLPGRGGARERTQFSPSGGNGVEWTLRRRAAMGKVTRRPQAAKFPLRTTNPIRTLPPHPSRLRRATFPPRGRLKKIRRRNFLDSLYLSLHRRSLPC